MSGHSDKDWIIDMYESCSRILDYAKNKKYEDLLNDRKSIDAILLNLIILGEASKNISNDLKNKYQNIKWSDIARTRDRIIHRYFTVDLEIIWDIITVDLPILCKKLEKIIQKEGWK